MPGSCLGATGNLAMGGVFVEAHDKHVSLLVVLLVYTVVSFSPCGRRCHHVIITSNKGVDDCHAVVGTLIVMQSHGEIVFILYLHS